MNDKPAHGITHSIASGSPPFDAESYIAMQSRIAPLDPEMAAMIRERRSITPDQWQDASNRKAQFMADEAKKAAHARNEVAALKEFRDINIILGRPVKAPE